MKTIKACFIFLMLMSQVAFAQTEKEAVVFDELYDEPYAINKLFIGFLPFYGEVFATNVNAGFGLEAHYYHKKQFEINAHFRKTYSSKFFDFNRELALTNSSVSNTPEIFNYYEFGGTYHIKDFDVPSTTKIFLHKKNTPRNRWASSVPQYAEVPGKLRKVYGVRVGSIIWNSTTDLSRTLEKQGLTNADLVTSEGIGLPQTFVDANGQTQNFNVFGNLYTANVYVGGSISLIRNIAVSFDTYEQGLDDGMLTMFLDVMVAPALTLDPVVYNGEDYLTNAVKTKKIGFRAGIDGRFNRTLSWSYGGEVGYRPSLEGRGFFALLKVSFPVFSSNLDNKVEAFGK
ncbi:MAG: hypothetical protein JNM78_01945 [Cyclobacteriaceae bacterium]|nr:hypothetical protein [Cyclobacteriaceae bacterium]